MISIRFSKDAATFWGRRRNEKEGNGDGRFLGDLRTGAQWSHHDRIGFRHERRYHTGDSDKGPGPTIEVDPNTWEPTSIELGDRAESQRQGYRYLITCTDGTVIHLSASDRIPEDIDVDPAAPLNRHGEQA